MRKHFSHGLFLRWIFFGCVLWLISACNSYQKVVKSPDMELKLEKAREYYQKKDYAKAIPLLEELITIFKGSKSIDEIYYLYAMSHFESNDYLVAAFHFKNIHDNYPQSPYAEECLYLNAVCYMRLSPTPSLDQEYTQKAINYFQLFVNAYPNSKKAEDCFVHIREMRRKMEKKSIDAAELYFKTKNYHAAAVSFENVKKSFPDSQAVERIDFMIIQSYFQYAKNSIPSKQVERFQKVVESYERFSDTYRNKSTYKSSAEAFYQAANRFLQTVNP